MLLLLLLTPRAMAWVTVRGGTLIDERVRGREEARKGDGDGGEPHVWN